MPGAQAMLERRSIKISELQEEFMAFHIDRERHRLYPTAAANEPSLLLKVA